MAKYLLVIFLFVCLFVKELGDWEGHQKANKYISNFPELKKVDSPERLVELGA